MPPTVVWLRTGTMSSPGPPRTIARTLVTQALRSAGQEDVAETLQRAEVRERAADHPRADERDLLPWHGGSSNRKRGRGASPQGSSHQHVSRSSIASNGSARTTSLPPCAPTTTQWSPSSR